MQMMQQKELLQHRLKRCVLLRSNNTTPWILEPGMNLFHRRIDTVRHTIGIHMHTHTLQ